MAVEVEEIDLSILGSSIKGWGCGPEDGIPTLALHGWLDNGNSFFPLAKTLDSRLRLVALDLPGHGRSAHRTEGAGYGFADWLVPVLGVADALGWESFILMGHSMGAGISTLVAGAFPEKIRALVLLEGLGPLTTIAEKAPAQLARHVRNRLEAEPERNPRVFANREEAAMRLQEAVSGLGLNAARLLVERGTHLVDGGYTWSTDTRLRTPSALRFTQEHVLAFLAAITAPSLLIEGESGMRFPESAYGPRLEAVRGLETVKLPGGHHLHMDAAAAVGACINRFLEPLLKAS